MDDFNRQLEQVRRAQALEAQARLAQEREEAAQDEVEEPSVPAGTGRLTLERRQGEWRYYLCGQRVRVGQPVEFYVDPRIGWVRGSFQWGRRNTAPPTLRIPVSHPDDPAQFVGDMVVSLPDDTICRWPAG